MYNNSNNNNNTAAASASRFTRFMTEFATAILRTPAPSCGSFGRQHLCLEDDHELLLVERTTSATTKLELVTGIRRSYEHIKMAVMREVFAQTNLRYVDIPQMDANLRKLVKAPPASLDVAVFHLLVRYQTAEHMYDCLMPNHGAPRIIEPLAYPPAVTAAPGFRLVWCSLRNLKRMMMYAYNDSRRQVFGPLLQWYMSSNTAHALFRIPGAFTEGNCSAPPVRVINFRALRLLGNTDAAAGTPPPPRSDARYNGLLSGPRVHSVDWDAQAASMLAAVSPAPTLLSPAAVEALPVAAVVISDDDQEDDQRVIAPRRRGPTTPTAQVEEVCILSSTWAQLSAVDKCLDSVALQQALGYYRPVPALCVIRVSTAAADRNRDEAAHAYFFI